LAVQEIGISLLSLVLFVPKLISKSVHC